MRNTPKNVRHESYLPGHCEMSTKRSVQSKVSVVHSNGLGNQVHRFSPRFMSQIFQLLSSFWGNRHISPLSVFKPLTLGYA